MANKKLEEYHNYFREMFLFEPYFTDKDPTKGPDPKFSYVEWAVLRKRVQELIDACPEDLLPSFKEVVCLPRDRWGKIPTEDLVKPIGYIPTEKHIVGN